ncbi:hypothetical protein TNCV_4834061 [Trichonephila clavipes]|nr:hypothetical protein TNCV_4834061 [Trichonephila clavipes]
MTDPHHSCLISSNSLTDFSESAIPISYYSFTVGFRNFVKRRSMSSTRHRLVEGEERREIPDHQQGVLPQNWGGTESNCTVTCMVLKTKANDRRKTLALSCDEFRGL